MRHPMTIRRKTTKKKNYATSRSRRNGIRLSCTTISHDTLSFSFYSMHHTRSRQRGGTGHKSGIHQMWAYIKDGRGRETNSESLCFFHLLKTYIVYDGVFFFQIWKGGGLGISSKKGSFTVINGVPLTLTPSHLQLTLTFTTCTYISLSHSHAPACNRAHASSFFSFVTHHPFFRRYSQ
jgi:hypothetical protein